MEGTNPVKSLHDYLIDLIQRHLNSKGSQAMGGLRGCSSQGITLLHTETRFPPRHNFSCGATLNNLLGRKPKIGTI